MQITGGSGAVTVSRTNKQMYQLIQFLSHTNNFVRNLSLPMRHLPPNILELVPMSQGARLNKGKLSIDETNPQKKLIAIPNKKSFQSNENKLAMERDSYFQVFCINECYLGHKELDTKRKSELQKDPFLNPFGQNKLMIKSWSVWAKPYAIYPRNCIPIKVCPPACSCFLSPLIQIMSGIFEPRFLCFCVFLYAKFLCQVFVKNYVFQNTPKKKGDLC